MDIPKLLFHGTFIPVGEEISGALETDYGYVCTTPSYDLARYFGMCKRFRNGD